MTGLRIGHGYDVHRLTEGRRLILGGVEVPYEKGLLGHSDADVLTHAVMDALLGAAALGDIGKLFPDTDAAYAGISSILLLERVAERLREAGYAVVNLDATVLAQAPKLAPYRERMRENLARALSLDASRVSVKATTEHFFNRRGGIMLKANFITAQEAAEKIQDGSTLCTIGMTLVSASESILKAIEKRFETVGHPADITLVHSCGQSDRKDGIQHLAHEGLVKRIVGSHWGLQPRWMEMIANSQVEAYCLPQGQIAQLYRSMACGLPGKMRSDVAQRFLEKLTGMIDFLLPQYAAEGRYALTIGIGCTGGQHRSVAVAKALTDYLAARDANVRLRNRDFPRT